MVKIQILTLLMFTVMMMMMMMMMPVLMVTVAVGRVKIEKAILPVPVLVAGASKYTAKILSISHVHEAVAIN
ncbi:MAG: hypothetical protein JSS83_14655 [Cyanobacteria bacterium SZAS LIN-3]|nr:hypothetical protein [Cyanobacteria bacterium SZAS LIN-3]